MDGLIKGTPGNDVIVGDANANVIIGNSGNDLISGTGGNDLIGGGSLGLGTGNRNIAIKKDVAGSVTFMGETAGYLNTIGMYEIGADGTISNVAVLFANGSSAGSGGNLTPGTSSAAALFKAGVKYGFFIVPNGYGTNAAQLNGPGSYALKTAAGTAANANDAGPLYLWHTSPAGAATLIKGAYNGETFHALGDKGTANGLNSDGAEHQQLRVDPATGSLIIAFEDLKGLGDRDFDDAIIRINIGAENAAALTAIDHLGYKEDDILHGGDGNDVARGGKGKDLIYGEADNDQLYGDSGDDKLWGGAGDDAISGGEENDQAWGGEGSDTLTGGKGNDLLWGEAGDDRLVGDSGNDKLYGGDGNDTAIGGTGNDAIYGGAGDDALDGGSGSDTLYDEAGNDTLKASSDNDRVYAGAGNDIYDGGSGVDWLDFSGFTTGGAVSLTAKTASIAGTDTLAGFENVMGSRGADTITGNSGANVLQGNQGNDVMTGGAGADTYVWAKTDVASGASRWLDTITDFGAGDMLDFRALPDIGGAVTLDTLVRLRAADGDTIVSAAFGPGGGFVDVVVLDGVTGLSAAQLKADGLLLV